MGYDLDQGLLISNVVLKKCCLQVHRYETNIPVNRNF